MRVTENPAVIAGFFFLLFPKQKTMKLCLTV